MTEHTANIKLITKRHTDHAEFTPAEIQEQWSPGSYIDST